jgi:hypothetical protein
MCAHVKITGSEMRIGTWYPCLGTRVALVVLCSSAAVRVISAPCATGYHLAVGARRVYKFVGNACAAVRLGTIARGANRWGRQQSCATSETWCRYIMRHHQQHHNGNRNFASLPRLAKPTTKHHQTFSFRKNQHCGSAHARRVWCAGRCTLLVSNVWLCVVRA